MPEPPSVLYPELWVGLCPDSHALKVGDPSPCAFRHFVSITSLLCVIHKCYHLILSSGRYLYVSTSTEIYLIADHIMAARGSGEHALRHILAPIAVARQPLEGALKQLKVWPPKPYVCNSLNPNAGSVWRKPVSSSMYGR